MLSPRPPMMPLRFDGVCGRTRWLGPLLLEPAGDDGHNRPSQTPSNVAVAATAPDGRRREKSSPSAEFQSARSV